MNASRVIMIIVGIVVAAVLLVHLAYPRPETRLLPEGYTLVYLPHSGHRYLVSPAGIKKVGQEVLDYDVNDNIVTGSVRVRLEHEDVRTFRIDLKNHVVTFGDRSAPASSQP